MQLVRDLRACVALLHVRACLTVRGRLSDCLDTPEVRERAGPDVFIP